jgi:hypothetical protein
MPPENEAGSLRRGHLNYLPVVPGRLEFALRVRRALLAEPPQVVAVELPGWLAPHFRQAVDRLPQMSAIVYPDPLDEERGVYIVIEPCDPFVEAIRTGLMLGAEIVFLEPDTIDRPHLPDTYPDTYAARFTGTEQYADAYRLWPQPRNDESNDHAAAMAWKLQGADPERKTTVVVSLNLLDGVLDAMQTPQEPAPRRRSRAADLVNLHPDCLAEIAQETPFLQEHYERFRLSMGEDAPDRRRIQVDLLKTAEGAHERNSGEKLRPWQRRLTARFARNMAMIENQLVAGLFDLTLAARGVVDDNYAWEVWAAANCYPFQQAGAEIETVNLSGEEVYLHTRKMRLRRRLPRPKRQLLPRGLKRRPREERPGEWAEQLDGNSICSYPPEDLIIEDYGKFLRQKARSMLSEERVRVEPFTTSLLDGIDLRETIRNWYRRKIYVRQFQKTAGDVGALVVVFDEDRDGRYSYETTWLGEHQNESDMAYYSTQPFENVVGPGIGRAEYGGFLMVLPSRRIMDVWSDPDYESAETKPERLLLAALDYSLERHVVYVAERPPRSVFRSIASNLNRSIIYIPIGQLSPAKLKKIRVVHVLDGHDKRKRAREFLW